MLPGADLDTARVLAERIRVGVQQLPMSNVGSVTISAGAAEFDTDYDFESTLRIGGSTSVRGESSGTKYGGLRTDL